MTLLVCLLSIVHVVIERKNSARPFLRALADAGLLRACAKTGNLAGFAGFAALPWANWAAVLRARANPIKTAPRNKHDDDDATHYEFNKSDCCIEAGMSCCVILSRRISIPGAALPFSAKPTRPLSPNQPDPLCKSSFGGRPNQPDSS